MGFDAGLALSRLVALSPPADMRVNALVRVTCARAVGLPALPCEMSVVAVSGGDGSAVASRSGAPGTGLSVPGLSVPGLSAESEAEAAVVDFAEQFAVDVTGIDEGLRRRLLTGLGEKAFRAVVLMYVADFVPRVRAGFEALGIFGRFGWGSVSDGLGDAAGGLSVGSGDGLDTAVGCDGGSDIARDIAWDHDSDPAAAVFNDFLPAVARLDALDPLTAELARLRGAGQHQCRLCKSLREGAALDAGGSENLYGDIERYEESALLAERHKAALRYVDALIWSPAAISSDVAAGVRKHFSDAQAVELTLDVMRNASNKIAVAFAADTPRVEHGTEIYRVLPDGQLEYT
ncbi:MAG: carboxymuconolactone decarboxylase family protein [Mycobacteriaceae bacterium]|nr:carboxymuconolactone decarboxylase family protein [Mycobacteriaceae bacterium]